MRTLTASLFACTFLLFATTSGTNLVAGEGHDHGDQNAEMAAWAAYATPTAVHKAMTAMEGKWNTSTKHWMGPGEPTISSGTATYKMLLGGRYLEGTHSSDTPMGPMEGISVMGYDNALEIFTSTWIDNMGTGISAMTGHFDAKTNTYHMTGTSTNPGAKGTMEIRSETKILSKDSSVFTMWGTFPGPDGKMTEFKMMEMTYTRA